ncbi:ABC transporter permease [Lactiplantibacillus sp. WILCCON 0030]|uniref:ABC transporter permease n=1 Tax=Lactiplantibacillus brownii TaxID=3069269 RepID=A0ABU1ABC0_9LACO|nr:ABC transporter permease [Lactiplantibacillus brownii]MDQ7937935.1 ABC transporter permease [Lactiplantibacillus brownii]
MTKFSSLFKAMSGSKFRSIHILMLLELAAVAVSSIWTLIQGNFNSGTLFYAVMGWSVIPSLVSFVLLAVRNEQAFTRDTFRLAPIKDSLFYAANLLSTFVSFLYLLVLQAVLMLLTALIGWSTLSPIYDDLQTNLQLSTVGSNPIGVCLGMLAIMLVIYLLAWSTVSLVHLITSAASNYLPRARQRLVNGIVYVIMIILTFRVVSFLMGQVAWISTSLMGGNTTSSWWVGVTIMLIIIVVETVANIFLLNKWVETTAN